MDRLQFQQEVNHRQALIPPDSMVPIPDSIPTCSQFTIRAAGSSQHGSPSKCSLAEGVRQPQLPSTQSPTGPALLHSRHGEQGCAQTAAPHQGSTRQGKESPTLPSSPRGTMPEEQSGICKSEAFSFPAPLPGMLISVALNSISES